MSALSSPRRAIVRGIVMAVLAAAVVVPLTSSPAAAITTPVDISVRLGLGDEERPFEANGVVPGPGLELDLDDEVPNDTGFCGAVGVDIDPDADTITLNSIDGDCFYDDVEVTVATDELTAVELVSNDLIGDSEGETTFDFSVTDGVLSVRFTSTSSIELSDDPEDGTVFSYALSSSTPAATLTPGSVTAGEAVVVTGTGCTNSPVEVLVFDADGEPIDIGGEALGDESGDWEFSIDTDALDAGTYSVESRCILADGQGFPYDDLTFAVTETPPTPPTPGPGAPSPSATPVVTAPTFTG